MSAVEPSGSSPSPLPVAVAIEKPDSPDPKDDRASSRPSRGIVIDPRVMFVGGAVALIGVAVFALFLWMVPGAAERELAAACRGLKPEPELKPQLCPGGQACSAPVPAPDFTAQDVTGKMVKLSDFRGKVVLLNFWASWCNVCKTEKPKLNDMASEMASKDDFVVLALASDRNWADALGAVLDSLAPEAAASLPKNPTMAQVSAAFRQALPNGTPFNVLLDPPDGDGNIGKIAASWGITAVPESALIDRQGNIRAYFGNRRDWRLPVVATCLQSLIDAR
ncbi:MAG TPA: TlpA disulfide reductase family protein [Kofleriaceae bacterium]